MNGIEKISARIEADAMAEIAVLEAEAKERCDEILAEAQAKADQAYAQRMEKGRSEAEQRRERLGAAADMEARKAILAFKQEMVGEAFEKAVEAIIGLSEAQYIEFLAVQAARASSNGYEELLFSQRDQAVATAAAKRANALLKEMGREGRLTVAAEIANIPGGLILRQGHIEVNCAVDTLVMMHRSRLAGQVASILFK